MKLLITLLFPLISLAAETKVAIIDDFSTPQSHGNKVSAVFSSYQGKLKFKPEVIELNSQNGGLLSFQELIQISIDLKVKVINLSFSDSILSPLEFSHDNYRILKKASDQGIMIVVAAGNDGWELVKNKHEVYPCMYRLPNLICVGSQKDGKINPMSNHGSWVYLYADGSYGKENMTSYSAPRVSQAIALFYDNSLFREFDRSFLAFLSNKDYVLSQTAVEENLLFEKTRKVYSYRGPL